MLKYFRKLFNTNPQIYVVYSWRMNDKSTGIGTVTCNGKPFRNDADRIACQNEIKEAVNEEITDGNLAESILILSWREFE
jgi:hypothetical protein